MKIQRLPLATIDSEYTVTLSNPYDESNRICCKPYGQMSNGKMVWIEEKTKKQYLRYKYYGKYYFILLGK